MRNIPEFILGAYMGEYNEMTYNVTDKAKLTMTVITTLEVTDSGRILNFQN